MRNSCTGRVKYFSADEHSAELSIAHHPVVVVVVVVVVEGKFVRRVFIQK